MKMHSDLGKMYRRNYMVKSQLRSLAEKSKALNAKIDGETKIDEWAESYITRADAQIDDVSDYMNYRNLAGVSKGTGHIINYTIYEHPPTGTPHQRQPAPPAPQPAPQPASSGKYETTLRFIASMPIELQVPFRRIHDRHDFNNIDNRIGAYGDATLIKDKFVRGGPSELADGRDKWFRLSQKYAEDAVIDHQRLNNLMEAWKNSTIKQVVQTAPTVSQVEAAIRQSKKFADRREDQAEIMAIAEGASSGRGSSSQYDALFGNLAHVRRPIPSTRALPAPKLPIYGQQRVAADEAPNADALSGLTDMLPVVTPGNTFGVALALGAMGGVYGLVTYNSRKPKGTFMSILKTRGKHALITAGVGAAVGLVYQGVAGTGQQTGWY